MDQADITASPKLRAAFFFGAAVMLAIWGATLPRAIAAIRIPRGDAFELIPAFWATVTLLPLGLVTLAGGISGRGKRVARARGALTIAAGLLVLVLLLEGLRRYSEMTGG